MKILALDPGGTTGCCVYDDSVPEGVNKFAMFQIGPGPHHLALWDLLRSDQWDTVIYEAFTYQRRELDKGVSLVLDSKEYIGVIKLWSEYQVVPKAKLIEHPTSFMSLFKDDDKLKKMGLYTPNAVHANDATRHLMHHLVVKLGQKHYLQVLKPPG